MEEAKNELDKAYNTEQRKYVEEKISIIKEAHVNHQARLVWRTVNEVTERKNSKLGRIKANSPEERVKLWLNHFKQLLGQPPVVDDQPLIPKIFDTLPIKTGCFTEEELRASIKSSQK